MGEIEDRIAQFTRKVGRRIRLDRIIAFGSRISGDALKDSDLDLMVVVPENAHRRKTAQEIYMNLIGVGFPVDVIVVTSKDIEDYKDSVGVVIPTAISEGREVYAA